MKPSSDIIPVHLQGEVAVQAEPHHVDTFDGRVRIDWEFGPTLHADGAGGLFYRFSEDVRAFRISGRRLPTVAFKPERI